VRDDVTLEQPELQSLVGAARCGPDGLAKLLALLRPDVAAAL
jgi:hypothetical protein